MPFCIDHIVIASDDLEGAITRARAAGFTVVPGGVHGSGNTHNALIGFADGSYLELFAPTPQGRSAEHRWFRRIRNGGGLVDYCLLGTDLKHEVARMREAGLEYSEPFAMARVTPDETRIEWLLSTPPAMTAQNGWPFMIQDTTPRAMRVPHAPDEIRHDNGSQGVAGITVLVRSVDASAKAYKAILVTEPEATTDAKGRMRCRFLIEGAWIDVREPSSAEERHHLERHGQGPYQLLLRSDGDPLAPEDASLLDAALFSGAKIAVACQRGSPPARLGPQRR